MKKITEQDLQGKGNVGMPDTPELSTKDMQEKLDELSRAVIIPAFNDNVAEYDKNKLAADTAVAAAQKGIDDHKADVVNPHKVTALQVEAYTKIETDKAINDKVQEIGSSDMTKAEYAEGQPEGKVSYAAKSDVADHATAASITDNALKLNGQEQGYYGTAEAVVQAQATADAALPQSGGTLTGDVTAHSANRTTSSLRNIEVRITSPTGALQSTNNIIMVRK